MSEGPRGGPPHPGAVVWQDGRLADPATAGVLWSDRGLTVGDGVFESVKVEAGRPFALRRHLDRLGRSAAALGLAAPDRALVARGVAEAVAAWGPRDGRLRITATSGPGPLGPGRAAGPPTLIVAVGPLVVDRSPATVLVVPWVRNERGPLAGVKAISYADNVVALARARAAGAGEALVGNTAGRLCEGTGTNVFVGLGGRLCTPPLSSGCLAGVTRDLLLEALAAAGVPAEEVDLPLDALGDVDEVLLASTTREVQPVERVLLPDGSERSLPAPGPLTERAAQAWADAYGAPDVTDP